MAMAMAHVWLVVVGGGGGWACRGGYAQLLAPKIHLYLAKLTGELQRYQIFWKEKTTSGLCPGFGEQHYTDMSQAMAQAAYLEMLILGSASLEVPPASLEMLILGSRIFPHLSASLPWPETPCSMHRIFTMRNRTIVIV